MGYLRSLLTGLEDLQAIIRLENVGLKKDRAVS